MRGSDLRARLRADTAGVHAELDAVSDSAGFFNDRGAYAGYLAATLRARRAIEQGLDAARIEQLFPLWPQRQISEALAADIADLGGLSTSATGSVPDYSPAAALGALYVLEGSALGARLLEKRAAALGMTPSFGGRHFAVQTARDGAWAALLKVMEHADLDADAETECVASALATFDRFSKAYRLMAA